MKRQEIIQKIAGRTGVEQKAVAKILSQFLIEIETAILKKRSLQLRPLGTLVVKRRRAKIGRNPITNEPVPVPEHLTVGFKPSRRMKKNLNR